MDKEDLGMVNPRKLPEHWRRSCVMYIKTNSLIISGPEIATYSMPPWRPLHPGERKKGQAPILSELSLPIS